MPYIDYNKIRVVYDLENDGGGTFLSPDYYHTIIREYPDKVFNRCLEWCAGPGFIGYNLLAKGVVKNISFLELYNGAVKNLEATKNLLQKNSECVKIYHSNNTDCLDECYNLIVGNPPHFVEPNEVYATNASDRLAVDVNWEIHKQFFNDAERILSADGIILLLENNKGSSANIFEDLIKNTNLKINRIIPAAKKSNQRMGIYYIEIIRKDMCE